MIGFLLASALASCAPQIPSPQQFTQPAIGTPFPSSVYPDSSVLPNSAGGVFYVNSTANPVKVAVLDEIVEIPTGDGFLFVLPAGEHDFFIYEIGADPKVHTEQTTSGKIRYVYLQPLP